jgi:hypothetical protein
MTRWDHDEWKPLLVEKCSDLFQKCQFGAKKKKSGNRYQAMFFDREGAGSLAQT